MLLFFKVNIIKGCFSIASLHSQRFAARLYIVGSSSHTLHMEFAEFVYLWRCFHGRGCRQTFEKARSKWQDWKRLCFEMLARCAKTSWSQLATFPLAECRICSKIRDISLTSARVEMRKRNVHGRSGVAQLLYAAAKQYLGMILGHFTHNCGDISLKS